MNFNVGINRKRFEIVFYLPRQVILTTVDRKVVFTFQGLKDFSIAFDKTSDSKNKTKFLFCGANLLDVTRDRNILHNFQHEIFSGCSIYLSGRHTRGILCIGIPKTARELPDQALHTADGDQHHRQLARGFAALHQGQESFSQ